MSQISTWPTTFNPLVSPTSWYVRNCSQHHQVCQIICLPSLSPYSYVLYRNFFWFQNLSNFSYGSCKSPSLYLFIFIIISIILILRLTKNHCLIIIWYSSLWFCFSNGNITAHFQPWFHQQFMKKKMASITEFMIVTLYYLWTIFTPLVFMYSIFSPLHRRSCFNLCLSAELHKNYWMEFHKTRMRSVLGFFFNSQRIHASAWIWSWKNKAYFKWLVAMTEYKCDSWALAEVCPLQSTILVCLCFYIHMLMTVRPFNNFSDYFLNSFCFLFLAWCLLLLSVAVFVYILLFFFSIHFLCYICAIYINL